MNLMNQFKGIHFIKLTPLIISNEGLLKDFKLGWNLITVFKLRQGASIRADVGRSVGWSVCPWEKKFAKRRKSKIKILGLFLII